MPPTRVLSRPSTRRFAPGFILRFPSPLQSSFALTSARSFRIEPTARVSSLFTTSPERVHERGASQASASFRPQAITASRRFTPHSGSEVCFTLEPCPGMFGVQGLLSPRSTSPSSGVGCLRAVVVQSARPDLTIRRPPSDASASRRCSTRSSVRTGSVLSLTGRRSPLRVRSPPGSLRYGWGSGFPAAHRSRHFDLRGPLARTSLVDAPSVSPP
jgi:hypothetical protein